MGELLARLAGMERLEFYAAVWRFNLNARWNGKAGKGDKFDREEGKRKAAELLAMPFPDYVLLGGEVSRAFGHPHFEPLNMIGWYDDQNRYRRILQFPHPSGINPFWNEPFNVHRAGRRLREFLGLPNNP
jgi:hypothetical protein